MSATSDHYQRVMQFMRFAGQEVKGWPALPSEEIRRLRAKLILEEAIETVEALGFHVYAHSHDLPVRLDMNTLEFDPVGDGKSQLEGGENHRLAEIADGCADIMVVTTGTLIACGIHDTRLLELVDENNLAKFGPGSYRREDGKWIKPPSHQPPDIQRLLTEQKVI